MVYHGNRATLGLGGRGQPADVTAHYNEETHTAISMVHPNFSSHVKSPTNSERNGP